VGRQAQKINIYTSKYDHMFICAIVEVFKGNKRKRENKREG
jgi:hypothetical protein